VPISRLETEQAFSLGRTTEITRDELKFTKFVQRIRKKFTPLFTDILKTNLLLKGVIGPEDWPKMQEHIQYDFLQDGYFAALKESELLEDRVNQLGTIEPYIGTFFSKEYVLKHVLHMTDAEIQLMRDQIKSETEKDPMDGGIILPPGGDGIQRIPVGPDLMPIDPLMPADDRAKMALGIPPEEEGEAPPEEEEPVEDEFDKSLTVKGKKK
jgi:hypothetical protein